MISDLVREQKILSAPLLCSPIQPGIMYDRVLEVILPVYQPIINSFETLAVCHKQDCKSISKKYRKILF